MQLVGAACSVCYGTIRFAPEAGGCPACKRAFHKACCSTPGRCPGCGGDFASATEAESHKTAAQVEAKVERGRRIVIWCSAAVVALQLLAVAAALVVNADEVVIEAARFLFLLVVVVAVYMKYRPAKILLVVTLVVNVVVSAFLVFQGVQDRDTAIFVTSAVVFVVYATSLAFLSSESADLYFARHREIT